MAYTAWLNTVWDSGSGVITGNPTVAAPVHDLNFRLLGLQMSTDRFASSAADQITSFGAVVGRPRDANGPLSFPAILDVSGTFRLGANTSFWVNRFWNSSEISGTVAVTVEDLDAGTIVTGPEWVICRNSGFNVDEHRFLPTNPDLLGSATVSGRFRATPLHNYRVWIDLHGHVSGAGFSSGAKLTAEIFISTISFNWYLAPVS